MKRKLLTFLLAIVSIFCISFALTACDRFSQSSNNEPNTDNENVNNTVITTEGLKLELNSDKTSYVVIGIDTSINGSQIEIPSTYEGTPITEISWNAFDNCTSITSIVIGDNITKINAFTFQGCTKLQSVTIPVSITYIGRNAFASGVTLEINYCGTEAQFKKIEFESRWNLSNNTVYNFLNNGNTGDSSGDSNTVTGEIFYEEYEVTGNTVKSYVVTGCVDIEELIVPSTYKGKPVVGIAQSKSFGISFSGVKSVSIPSSVEYIYDYAFNGCSMLTTINIPNSVTGIGKSAFMSCISLTNMSLGSSLRIIDNRAFFGCTNLEKIIIPNTVAVIGDSALYNCTKLEDITFNGSKTEWNAIFKDNSWNYNTGNYTVHCSDGALNKN